MKILTKEQEREHYNAVLYGGTVGGTVGLAVGFAGVALAQRRYQYFRSLTLPLKAFLITSSGTFAGIINADHYSRKYESESNPLDVDYRRRESEKLAAERAGKSFTEKAMDFGRRERYKIVGASWIASMATAFALVNRNKYLSGPQKLVQARVYAQFLTVGVLVATAAFEISDSETPKDDMKLSDISTRVIQSTSDILKSRLSEKPPARATNPALMICGRTWSRLKRKESRNAREDTRKWRSSTTKRMARNQKRSRMILETRKSKRLDLVLGRLVALHSDHIVQRLSIDGHILE